MSSFLSFRFILLFLFYAATGKWHSCTVDLIRDAASYFSELEASMLAAGSEILILGHKIHLDLLLGFHRLEEILVKKKEEGVHLELKNWQSWGCNFAGLDYFMLLNLESHDRATSLGISSELRLKKDWLNLFWTYHEKMVIVDSEIYLGSTDLASGRWDESSHPLESQEREKRMLHLDLDNVFCEFPWHDIQLRITSSEEMRKELALKYFGVEVQGKEGSQVGEDACELVRTDEECEETYERILELTNDEEVDFVYMEHQMVSSFPFAENRVLQTMLERVKRDLQKGKTFRVTILTNLYFGDPVVTYGNLRSLFFGEYSFYTELSKFLDQNFPSRKPEEFLSVFFLAKANKSLLRTIYVHGKIFFFGFQNMLAGSSNLNDRSLKMDRDIELNVHVKSKNVERFLKELVGEHLNKGPERIGNWEDTYSEMMEKGQKNLEMIKRRFRFDPEEFNESYFSGEAFEKGWASLKDSDTWEEMDGHLVWFPPGSWKLVRENKMTGISYQLPYFNTMYY